eukprot:TRINITY_DN52561_c0_g1_i1.p1 TRINITY_DN52561_c0_g1~~TRINITY_DN52561_c0_g1_i1.p1  ORF type:complete len:339 (-),score=35.74 TRINITY_DN52561_c0_g1_i1:29-1045(-)
MQMMRSLVASCLLALSSSNPIIGGQGKYRYQYMPDLLEAPLGAEMVNCHGLVLDADHNIYLTYQNDGHKDTNCLIKWNTDGTGGEFMTGGGTTLCSGEPHGLKIANEGGSMFFYHANNDEKLTKSKLNGEIVWQVLGNFGQDPTVTYRPTWFATPPVGFLYLCDGYGSNNVYVFDREGRFMNRTFGGIGDRTQHGKFSTNHGCTYDPRNGKIAVSDRANQRIEYFDFGPSSPDHFSYNYTVDMQAQMGPDVLPCNLRMYPEQDGVAIMPDLNGTVAILDKSNVVVSVVHVAYLLAAAGHKHPHDAILLPNGDMVVATWNPGRISYWKKLPADPSAVLV